MQLLKTSSTLQVFGRCTIISKTCTRHWDFCQSSSSLREKQAGAQQGEKAENFLGNLLQKQLYVILDLDCFETPAVAFEGHAVGADEELLEVPGDVIAADGGPDDVLGVGHQRGGVIVREGQRLFQECEEGVLVLPVHLALLEHHEIGLVPVARTNVLEHGKDLLVGAVFLRKQGKPALSTARESAAGAGGSSPLPSPAPRAPRPPYLVTELVAGEAEDLEPAGAVALLQLVELQEVARGRASERRHIGHQQHLAPQRAQRQRLRRAQGPRRQPRQPRQRRRSPARCRRRHGAHC